MFPIPWNFPFRKKDGSLSTISAEMGGVLPPATADKLGGVKVGSGLSVTSDGTLSSSNVLPAYTSATAGKVLGVNAEGALAWSKSLKIDKYSESNLSKTLSDDGFIIIINHGDTTSAHVTITIPNEITKTFDINNTTNSPITFPVVAGTTIAITNDGGARNSVYYYH